MNIHAAKKSFRINSKFSFKKVHKIKQVSNTLWNKLRRKIYVKQFLPYHKLDIEGKIAMLYLDESSFNMNFS